MAVKTKFAGLALFTVGLSFALGNVPGLADAISPSITGAGRVYSKEAPNAAYFGTGIAGRLTEASSLRFEGEQETMAGNYDVAITKLTKAVQLDAADPTGHILYARALSGKLRTAKEPDMAQIQTALREWRLIWHHDADLLEQVEGRRETHFLVKLAKAAAKREKDNQAIAQVEKKPAAQTTH